MLEERLTADTRGEANPQNMVVGEGFRITVLKDRLFRVEIRRDKAFEDRASQAVWFRYTPKADFSVAQNKRYLEIDTKKVKLVFDKKKRRVKGFVFEDGRLTPYSPKGNLGGTRRTLDMTRGPVKPEPGLVSRQGLALLDDSDSLILNPDGMPAPRQGKGKDLYYFAYGENYREAVNDFYDISGRPPLLPRYAFGVWWSRFKAYSQDEYLGLMDRFEEEGIPLTVATVDMDWHWTDLNSRFGTNYKKRPMMDNPCTGGWTGYSWNSQLFPDYRDFLRRLKEKNLAVTLNLHPADGIRFHEDMYPQMASAMGMDPAKGEPVNFSPANSDFWNNYFKYVIHPYEKDGVDFWWIDWQQGEKSDLKGLDPLWALNHFHFLDNSREGKRPLILSRYAGPGGHRYPLGFSGDSLINKKVLEFQPYFTVTASNIGYTRWSHDIGGHMFGRRDDDLYLRWLQLGVFSPIMRLHSSAGDLLGKEPWTYPAQIANLAKEQLRLRHKLIPYIYSSDYETHTKGRALCEPLYYLHPEYEESYVYKHQFMFGKNLLVIPIAKKTNPKLGLADVSAWIPSGRWTDIFTGDIYEGPKKIDLYRDLGSMPVLAKAGAIIPLSADAGNRADPPKNLELWVYRGQGFFELHEDEGNGTSKSYVSRFEIQEEEKIVFKAYTAKSGEGILPQKRNYKIIFKDLYDAKAVSVYIDDILKDSLEAGDINYGKKPFEIDLNNIDAGREFRIEILKYRVKENRTIDERKAEIFSLWQAGNIKKTLLYYPIKKEKDPVKIRRKIKFIPVPSYIRKALKARLDY